MTAEEMFKNIGYERIDEEKDECVIYAKHYNKQTKIINIDKKTKEYMFEPFIDYGCKLIDDWLITYTPAEEEAIAKAIEELGGTND